MEIYLSNNELQNFNFKVNFYREQSNLLEFEKHIEYLQLLNISTISKFVILVEAQQGE